MTSSISDYSPTSNYEYPAELSLSPSSPIGGSRPQSTQLPPPRLSSPHIFRDIFTAETAGPSTRSPPRLPPLHGINFAETMQDVNRALQSANRAIQTAQEAFRSGRTPSTSNTGAQDFVDLTDSPPSPSRRDISFDSFLAQTIHPHDSRSNNGLSNRHLDQPFYPRPGPSAQAQSLFVEEDDPTSRYAGQSDSLAAARRRFEGFGMQRVNNHRRSFMNIPTMERMLLGAGFPDSRRQEEEDAIRRQRVAREQWQRNQQRQQQRNRLQQQRDRILARPQQGGEHRRLQNLPDFQAHPTAIYASAETLTSGTSLPPNPSQSRPPTSSPSMSSPSVEAVDLTLVNDKTDLAAALIQSQTANTNTDHTNASSEPRSALTGYKCPICLEPPRNATSTICGHLFCHDCIIETLKNSENMRREDAPPHRKVKGQCPVCRKELARNEEENQRRTLVPLEIKLISKKRLEEMRRQERKRQRDEERKEGKGKGKERASIEPNHDKEIFELSSDNENDWGASGSSQKENKAKRVKLSTSEELDEELFGAYLNVEQGQA